MKYAIKLILICMASCLVLSLSGCCEKHKAIQYDKETEVADGDVLFKQLAKYKLKVIKKTITDILGKEGATVHKRADGKNEYYVIKQGRETVGAAAVDSAKGFIREIVVLVVVDKDMKIAGIKILKHWENRPLGAFRQSYLDQFKGKKSPDEAGNYSRATYTCVGVKNAVKKAMALLAKAPLK